MFHSVALPLHFADKVPLALIQLGETSKDKSKNLAHAREYVTKAVQASVSSSSSEKPRMVVLPECWNSPYGVQYFDTYAEDFGGVYEAVKAKIDAERVEAVATSVEEDKVEEVAAQQQKLFEKRWTVDGASPLDVSKSPSETILMMSQLAKELNVVLVGGSIPERDGKTGKLYNTATVFDEQGRLISMHRKLHLFDIDIPGKMTFQESKTLTAGDRITVFECSLGRFGLAICYDLRFPELATVASRLGAGAVLYPGAFNTTTGPRSWKLLQRGRAADNQVYIVACSPARPSAAEIEAGAYPTYGHSMVVDPWGKVVKTLDEKQDTLFLELQKNDVEEVRKFVPVARQRRFDVYSDVARG